MANSTAVAGVSRTPVKVSQNNGRSGERFEYLSLQNYGCPADLLTVCPRRRIQQSYSGSQDVFILDLIEIPTAGSVCTSWSVPHHTSQQDISAAHLDLRYVLDPGERIHDYLCAFYQVFQGKATLYIRKNCSATKARTIARPYRLFASK